MYSILKVLLYVLKKMEYTELSNNTVHLKKWKKEKL